MTQRELEILTMLAIGLTAKETADHLGNSYYTVRNQIQKMIKKLGARNVANAVWICRHRIDNEMGDLIRAVQRPS